MRQWRIGWHSEKIYGSPAIVHLVEVPWWAIGVEAVAEKFDTVSSHLFCNPPNWTWDVPVTGLKKSDDSAGGFGDHSLGAKLADLGNHLLCFSYRHEKVIHELHLTREWIEENNLEDPIERFRDLEESEVEYLDVE